MAQSVRCDRAVDYEGSSFCSDVFQVSYNPRGSTFLAVEKASAKVFFSAKENGSAS